MVRSVVTTYASDTLAHAAAGLGYAGREARVPRRRKGHRWAQDTFPFGDLRTGCPSVGTLPDDLCVHLNTQLLCSMDSASACSHRPRKHWAPSAVPSGASAATQLASGRVGRALPGLALLLRYDRSQWRNDAVAALVVALVLIPSAFAYADLAQCSPAAGIYASAAGMVVFALFTSSRHVVVGPDAAIALMVGAAIGPLAADDPGKAVTLATVLAFLTGGVLLLMARLRLGIAADFLSSPALLGFMNGEAVVSNTYSEPVNVQETSPRRCAVHETEQRRA